jgi:hypothetical protein
MSLAGGIHGDDNDSQAMPAWNIERLAYGLLIYLLSSSVGIGKARLSLPHGCRLFLASRLCRNEDTTRASGADTRSGQVQARNYIVGIFCVAIANRP